MDIHYGDTLKLDSQLAQLYLAKGLVKPSPQYCYVHHQNRPCKDCEPDNRR